jgi:hypothetical protein
MGACAVQTVNSVGISDEHRIGPADEQTTFHHADNVPDALIEPRRIGDAAEVAIDDPISAIGDEWLAARR